MLYFLCGGIIMTDLQKKCLDTLDYHNAYIRENGVDIPEVVNFKWHGKEF